MKRWILPAVPGLAAAMFAQDRPTLPQYRLHIELIEKAGANTGSAQVIRRSYELLAEANSLAKINASVRAPYVTRRPDDPQVRTVPLGGIY